MKELLVMIARFVEYHNGFDEEMDNSIDDLLLEAVQLLAQYELSEQETRHS